MVVRPLTSEEGDCAWAAYRNRVRTMFLDMLEPENVNGHNGHPNPIQTGNAMLYLCKSCVAVDLLKNEDVMTKFNHSYYLIFNHKMYNKSIELTDFEREILHSLPESYRAWRRKHNQLPGEMK